MVLHHLCARITSQYFSTPSVHLRTPHFLHQNDPIGDHEVHVRVYDDPHARVYDDPHVRVYDDPHVRVYDDPHVRVYDDPHVRVYDDPHVRVDDDPHVRVYDGRVYLDCDIVLHDVGADIHSLHRVYYTIYRHHRPHPDESSGVIFLVVIRNDRVNNHNVDHRFYIYDF